MNVTDEEQLRALVRDAVARKLGELGPRADTSSSAPGCADARSHASHFRYTLQESDGPCLIEPAVPCNHCGYCQSHGH